jgi:parallel beta-helix repeat protein
MDRGRWTSVAAVVALAAIGAVTTVSNSSGAATTCSLAPVLRDITVNQGLGSYPQLVRGKETLVRLYMSLPSCASRTASISVTGGTLTISNGATAIKTVTAPTPALVSPFPTLAPYTSAAALDSPADVKFVIAGSDLPPAASNIAGAFTATFKATINYTNSSGQSGSVTLTSVSGSTAAITRPVTGPTNALRILVVPMGSLTAGFDNQFPASARTATENAMLTLSRIFPVRDGIGDLSSTTAGLRYTINPTLLDISSVMSGGSFCASPTTWTTLKGLLAQYLQSWNSTTGNPPADKVLGVASLTNSAGGTSGCAEGLADVNSTTAFARMIPDGQTPSMSGAVASMEIAHTFGMVPGSRSYYDGAFHSLYTAADTTAPNRGYNVAARQFLSDDHTVMDLSGTWNNANTLLERDEWNDILCKLGGPTTQTCTTAGTVGTAAAAPTFVLSGTSDGTPGGTSVVESYFGTGIPRTPAATAGDYAQLLQLVQLNGNRTLSSTPVGVSKRETHHEGGNAADSVGKGVFTAAIAFNTAATRIELRNGTTVLYARDKGQQPSVTSLTTSSTGASAQNYTNDAGNDDNQPDVSPNGKWVAWNKNLDADWVVVAPIGDASNYADGPYPSAQPAWNPGGDKLAYVGPSWASNAGDLYVVPVDTSGARASFGSETKVYDAGTGTPAASHPTWSPDGTEIAFAADGNIWKISAAGGTATKLTTSGDASSPSWSKTAGDSRIAYVRTPPIFLAGTLGYRASRTAATTTTTKSRAKTAAKTRRALAKHPKRHPVKPQRTKKAHRRDTTHQLARKLPAPLGTSLESPFTRVLAFHDPAVGRTSLLSLSTSGAQGDNESRFGSLSDDGRQVAFISLASNFGPDANGKYDYFVRNRDTGLTTKVGDATGAAGVGHFSRPAISGNGRYVAFDSNSDAIVGGDTNGKSDVFVYDRDTDADGAFDEPGAVSTDRVSVADDESQFAADSWSPSISDDGRYVSFGGPSGGFTQILVRDRVAGTTRVMSVSSAGVEANTSPNAINSMSSTGRYVAFASAASNLVGDDTNGVQDIYLHDRDADADGTFDEPDGTSTERVSVSSAGAQGDAQSLSRSGISDDGRFVTFQSEASNLVSGDTNGKGDIFVRDRTAGTTEIVSRPTGGTPEANDTSFAPSISGDGRYVAFDSLATNLVAEDTNTNYDVFLRDRTTGNTDRMSVSSDGMQGNSYSFEADISGNGNSVVFDSDAADLVADDTNGFIDVFVRDDTFVVNSAAETDDLVCDTSAGGCTLADAIEETNVNPGLDTITFNIPGSGAQTIFPDSAPLPSVSDRVVIDGTTQPGYAGTPLIGIYGGYIESEWSGQFAGITLAAGSDGSTVRGLALFNNNSPFRPCDVDGGSGILIASSGNRIESNFIGNTDPAGSQVDGNECGILIQGGANNRIGVLGGTTYTVTFVNGLANQDVPQLTASGSFTGGPMPRVRTTTGTQGGGGVNEVQQATVSGDPTGGTFTLSFRGQTTGSIAYNASAAEVASALEALSTVGSGNVQVVRSAVASGRNLISGNQSHGVLISGSGATGNAVEGNSIGTDAAGTGAIANGREGVRVEADSNRVVDNLVSANNGFGVLLHGASTNVVQGNYAGTDGSGTLDLGNGVDGIGVDGGGSNTIQGNVASGNANQGIAVFGVDFPGGTSGNVVQRNVVGTKADGTGGIGNGGDGIRVHNGSNNVIGGPNGLGNIVMQNSGPGIAIFDGSGSSTANAVRGNAIFGNGALGIDLGNDGVTANDTGDGDSGPNNLQNFPTIASAANSAGGTTITGTLNSAPSATYTLDFFSSSACDTPGGNGEGGAYRGSSTVTTDPSGNGSFTFTTTTPYGIGEFATATATDPSGNTSEFSACQVVTASGPPPVSEEGIWTIDPTNASPESTLDELVSPGNQPSWGANGTVAFSRSGDIYTVNGDGSSVTPVATNGSWPSLGGTLGFVRNLPLSIEGTQDDVFVLLGGTNVTVQATDDRPQDDRLDLILTCPGRLNYLAAVAVPSTVSGTTATFTTGVDPGLECAGGTLKAFVSDGYWRAAPTNAGQTQFSSEQRSPTAAIYVPFPGMRLLQYSNIPLRGAGFDPEDGALAGSSLAWTVVRHTGSGDVTVGTGSGERVDLSPPGGGGWTPGNYTARLLVTDSATNTDTASRDFTIKADGDNDGLAADEDPDTTCTAYTGDNDPSNAYADSDGDGTPNLDEVVAGSGVCASSPAPLASATADFDPTKLFVPSNGTYVTVFVRVPSRDLTELVPGSVRIVSISGRNQTYNATTDPDFFDFPNSTWSVSGGVGTAKFDRQLLNSFLASHNLVGTKVTLRVVGRSTVPAWRFDTTATTTTAKG